MLLQRHKFSGKFILLVALLLIVFSCNRYYQPVKYKGGNGQDSVNFVSTNSPVKYFILHKGEKSYALEITSIDKDKLTISGKLHAVDPSHRLYVEAKGRPAKYKYKNDTRGVLNEIHMFVNSSAVIDTVNPFVLPLSQLEKIEVIERDEGRTIASYILGGIGIGLGALAVVVVIALATKESCPFISVYDGEQFKLQGELFGGAVNRQLERMDYIPLKALPVNGEYRIRISNELKEKQYTNFADLLVVEHPANVQVLPDADGKLYQFSDPQTPVAAQLNNKDVLRTVTNQDEVSTNFSDTTNASGINELNLFFSRRQDAKTGKLILRLKNSYWLDYLYGEFTRHFGSGYENWIANQQKKPAEEMNRWTEEQNIPLTVSIKTKTGWREIQKLKTVGPLVNRNIIIPFEPDANSNEPINIKLSTGFMFWELDYAAVDFSNDQPLPVTRLKPVWAKDNNGNSVLPELIDNDKKYLDQPQAGQYAILKYHFKRKPKPGNTFSVIFHTSGYYEPIRQFTGEIDLPFLNKFKDPGYFSMFSLNHFQKLSRQQAIAVNKN